MAFGTNEITALTIIYAHYEETGSTKMLLPSINPLDGVKMGENYYDTLRNLDSLGYLSFRYSADEIIPARIILDDHNIQKIKEELAK